jgi:diaminopimelate epimerase
LRKNLPTDHHGARAMLNTQPVLRFSKMHGLGNDFVMVDCREQPMPLDTMQLQALSNRRTGVGFDQLLSIEPARDPACAFAYGIWNADGSAVGQCGNGVRCVAAWLHRAGLLALDAMVQLQSPSGPVSVRLLSPTEVTVDMGEPIFDPPRIPFLADAMAPLYALDAGGEDVEISALSMGNPHGVLSVDDLDDPRVLRLGPLLTMHPRFPEEANIAVVQKLDRSHVRVHEHERGAGWTQACGSGACATAVALRQRGEVDATVEVHMPGGSLHITWGGAGDPVWMTGPAAFVFEGEWPITQGAF